MFTLHHTLLLFDRSLISMTYVCCSGCHEAANELLVRKMENNTPITELHFERCFGKNIDHISVALRRLYVMSLIQQNMMIADMGTIVVLAPTSTAKTCIY
jgi:hypothetical protein